MALTQMILFEIKVYIPYDDEIEEKIDIRVNNFAAKAYEYIKAAYKRIIPETCFMHFSKCEYYRRSSKSRALFEHLLFKLGLISVDNKDSEVGIAKNLSLVDFSEEEWADQKQIHSYDGWGLGELQDYKKIHTNSWENGQWFELNNIMPVS